MKKLLLISSITMLSASFHSQVSAHGWVEFPAARQVICSQDGGHWSNNGQDIPNQACKAAYDISGTYPFVQINEFAALTKDYRDIEAVKRQVPNGELCSAGASAKLGMSNPSSEWQKTKIKLDSNNQILLTFHASAPHNPSFWEFYLTKPDYDPSQALTWDDLELVDTEGNVAVSDDRKYRIKVTLPADRKGDAILYTRWQRDDPAGEGFYNCSDINFSANGTDGNGGDIVDPEDPTFNELGYYLPQGFPTPNVDDYVSFRGFNNNGQEQLEERLLITANNQDNWPELLALQVNDKHKNKWFIGVWHAEMQHYMYDRQQPYANKVWNNDSKASYALSIVHAEPPIDPPTPPQPGDNWNKDTTYNEGDTAIHLGKHWQAHWWTKGDEPGTTGEWGVWREINGTTPPLPPEPPVPPVTGDEWNMEATYTEGQQVTHNQVLWQAHWWTKGEEPGTTGEWGVWRAVK
ncbi:MAG: lytic polysaccharide monooxygenase [Shewanella sp.]